MNSQATDSAFRERLAPLVRQGVERAREQKQDVLVSVTDEYEAIDPLRLFANTGDVTSDRWYWEYPDGQLAIATAGVITGSTYPRKVRFSETEWNHRKLMERAVISPEPGPDNPGPVLFAAFSFDPYRMQDRLMWQGFPSSFLLLPRVVLLRSLDRHLFTINMLIGPNREPEELIESTSEFREIILQALAEEVRFHHVPTTLENPDASAEKDAQQFMDTLNGQVDRVQAGDFEWLTAVRRLKITTSQLFDVNRMIDRLRTEHPEFRTVAAARHGSSFVGLSRDVLASVQGDSLTTTCSFGSIRRGDNEELDEALANHLRNDEQTLEQHELMVQSHKSALEPLADSTVGAEEPELWSLDEHHVLQTRIQVKLQADGSLMQAVKALHPTAAQAGYPVRGAYENLREHENVDRGWFCSPFGWFDFNGNGEFVAPDRAAVVRAPVLEQQRAFLFSAAPVLSSTDPDQQLAESEKDLAPLLAALTE